MPPSKRLAERSGTPASYLRLIPVHDNALRWRLQVVAGVILISFCLLLARVGHLQVIQGHDFLRLAEQNRLRHRQVPSLRGKILDREGHILATNRPAYALIAMPEDLQPQKELQTALQKLNIRLDHLDAATRRTLLSKTSPQPIIVQPDMPRDQVAYFVEHRMDYPGLDLDITPLRSYPHGALVAHLLGYMGQMSDTQLQQQSDRQYDAEALVGQYGLERQYESVLRGISGIRRVEVDTFGRETQQLAINPPVAGANLVLTLDLALQQTAEQLLETHTGSIVALDPRNGEILASVSNPAFDPNLFAARLSSSAWTQLTTDPQHPLHNRVIQGQYPPGSLFKIVTAIAALEDGVITPRTTMCCHGHYTYGRRTYRDWKHAGHGCVDLYQALVQSCDVYFYHVGQEVGVDRLAHYARAFGLGQVTGVAPGTEKPGLMPSKQWKRQIRGEPWYGGETLSVAIGQGYTLTTPLQVANLMATVANGGTLYRPYAVRRQERWDGAILHETTPEVVHRLDVKPRHLQEVKKSLWGVIHDAKGTGRQARHERIAIAGKTATVQVVRLPKDGGGPNFQARLPAHQRDHAWFAAFAPVDDPRIVVVVMIEHAGKGGSQFAHIAKTLVQTYLERHLVSAHLSHRQTQAMN
ncbi:MAG TPA: penicillin-binding protein 2 [Candidatus Entotheonella sp.]